MLRRIIFVLALLALLTLAGASVVTPEQTYVIDWIQPMTGSGGVTESSAYSLGVTLGQTAVGSADSQDYHLCLGFWCILEERSFSHEVFLPSLRR